MTNLLRLEKDQIFVGDQPLGRFDLAFLTKDGKLVAYNGPFKTTADVVIDFVTVPSGMVDVMWFAFENMIAVVNTKSIIDSRVCDDEDSIIDVMKFAGVQSRREGFVELRFASKTSACRSYVSEADAHRFDAILKGSFGDLIHETGALRFA
jgi:hypothetical protein